MHLAVASQAADPTDDFSSLRTPRVHRKEGPFHTKNDWHVQFVSLSSLYHSNRSCLSAILAQVALFSHLSIGPANRVVTIRS